MGKHALLSASSSKRWLSCTPSARLEEQFKDEAGGNVYAEEGTAAHALAEHKLKKALKRRSKRPVSDYHCDEMEECTDGYVAYAMEQVELARQECADPVVLIEQRLDYSAYVPEGFGTGDLLIVADHILTVIDFKYGKGVPVDAEWNPQMMLYGLGALELFDALYDIEIIRMTIYQPRLESVSTWEVNISRQGIRSGTQFRSTGFSLRTTGSLLGSTNYSVVSEQVCCSGLYPPQSSGQSLPG